MDYFNSTAAWALAYAISIGVEKIALFGYDFTYPNSEKAERGRGCVEYIIGYARAKGVNIKLANKTTLLDMMLTKKDRLYGYDTLDLEVRYADEGKVVVKKTDIPEEEWPTAEDIEGRYNHSKHPNEMVRNGQHS